MKYKTRILLLLITLISCNTPTKDQQKSNTYEFDFYWPEMYDDWWRSYDPKLDSATGWISSECSTTGDSINIRIIGMDLKHKSWGNYYGSLIVEIISTSQVDTVDFTCFFPDYNEGEWLNQKEPVRP